MLTHFVVSFLSCDRYGAWICTIRTSRFPTMCRYRPPSTSSIPSVPTKPGCGRARQVFPCRIARSPIRSSAGSGCCSGAGHLTCTTQSSHAAYCLPEAPTSACASVSLCTRWRFGDGVLHPFATPPSWNYGRAHPTARSRTKSGICQRLQQCCMVCW